MTLSKIKSLIANECASYDRVAHGIHHYCCHEPNSTKQCLYLAEDNNRRCKYFEEAILPLDPQLIAIYSADMKAQVSGYDLTRYQKKLITDAIKREAVCPICGRVFSPVTRRQKLCQSCKKHRVREQARIRKQNQRKRA